jgi:isoleucyl-tRNA synthetase
MRGPAAGHNFYCFFAKNSVKMSKSMAQNQKTEAIKKADQKKTEKVQEKSVVALREEETLAFWREKKIFNKSLQKTSGILSSGIASLETSLKTSSSTSQVLLSATVPQNSGEFIFYDGPPFATGQPHYGHILPGTIKDVIPRYKTMRGFHVRRQWGWDCHGLPIENLIEKELGLKNKRDILELGIGKFNAAARASVMRYADDWKRIIPRTGRWVNMDDDYKTMDTSYTESVWWSFKTLYDKGLAYEGFKSMLLCPRCETTLSNFEVNQGYRDVTDISVYVKFELVEDPGTFLLAWTTTPWTLPGNVALAVNPKMDYVTVSVDDYKLIVAKPRLTALQAVTKKEYPIVSEQKGIDLIGKSYKPLFDYYSNDSKLKNREKGWKVYGADFVTTEDGTGIVHIAPAFGADDLELGQQENLPFIQHVSVDGRFKPEVADFAGQLVKPKDSDEEPNAHQKADVEIIKYLAQAQMGKNKPIQSRDTNALALFAKEKITHSYPHCWRCDTPLLNYATSSWFIKVIAIKDDLLAANSGIKWVPENIRDGRFGKWLEGAKDWAVSRSRFWGAPIPIWRCNQCLRIEVFGSISDVRAKIIPRNTYYVMRHAQAENNVRGVVDSKLHMFHLTKEGETQAHESGKTLVGKGIDLIITSPFNRTEETGNIVRAELGLREDQMIQDERVHEIGMGIYNGKTIEEYHSHFSSYEERFTKPVPEGETCNDVRKRVGEFLNDIDSRYEGKTILIVSHDTPAWLMFANAAGVDMGGAIALHADKSFFLQNAEVRKLDFVQFPHNEFFETDLHRPGIDGVMYPCATVTEGGKQNQPLVKSACAGVMKRVPEVFDTWYDSGSMPYASRHYPFENLDKFNPKEAVSDTFNGSGTVRRFGSNAFPADFIAEGSDQTRGWFYTLMVLSVGLFGKAPFKEAVVNGLILAEDGRKMSKRLNNFPEISYIIDRYGADALRYYLMSSPAVHAEDFNFSEKGVDEVYKKLILRLQNVLTFYEMYASESKTNVSINISLGKSENKEGAEIQSDHVLDLWIKARLSEVVSEVTSALETYEIDRAAWPLEAFIDDLSTWYLRRSRERFKGDDVIDKQKALATTAFVLREFAKVCAPFMPFIAEEVYQKILPQNHMNIPENIPESVHLCDWPKIVEKTGKTQKNLSNGGKTDSDLLKYMAEVRLLVTLGLEARSKAGIKVRQPLASMKIKRSNLPVQLSSEWLELIKDEVNVKIVNYDSAIFNEVELDTMLTQELKEEGILREFIRAVQELRKKNNFEPNDTAELEVFIDKENSIELKKILQANRDIICKATGLKRFEFLATQDTSTITPELNQEIVIGDYIAHLLLTK